MWKINFLRNLLLLSLSLAISVPLYDYLFIYPSYRQILIDQTETEAVRFVRFLVSNKRLEEIDLETDPIDKAFTGEVDRLKNDEHLVKLRIFSPSGEIVYSTQQDEIGSINQKDYFHHQVARGEVYSKVVRKDRATADGATLQVDVVETYVPLMHAGQFHGAIEVYYDITESQTGLQHLNRRASLLLITFSFAFMLLIYIGLRRARLNFQALQRAENQLKEANETLEKRVVERTEQLQATNRDLNTEIVERRSAEVALQEALQMESEARTKIDTILSSVADALLVTDSQDRIVLTNRVAEDFLQLNGVEAVQPLARVMKNPEAVSKIYQAKERLEKGESGDFDLSLCQGDEPEERIFSARTSLLRDADGKSRGMVTLLQDVTQVRSIERMKSEFVSMAAHEFRTPLTMILGYSELLLENGRFSEAEWREFLGVINEKAVDLSSIVDDLLDVTRIEDGRPLDLYIEPLDIRELVMKMVTETEERDEGQHKFRILTQDDHYELAGDRGRLQQVVENLLSNAVKYSPHGGEISIKLEKTETQLDMIFKDEGIGMTAEQLVKAFDRFYRADTSDSGIRGTGLGLSIVRYIVEAHGGEAWLNSQPGQGTAVTVRLPLHGGASVA